MPPIPKAPALLFGAALIALALFVWPTPWYYGTERRSVKPPPGFVTLPIRTHRITGERQTYFAGKWSSVPFVID